MKLSISLSDHDVAASDAYVVASGLSSRSAAIQRAIALLAEVGLEEAYVEAWAEWDTSGEGDVWSVTSGDGLVDAAR